MSYRKVCSLIKRTRGFVILGLCTATLLGVRMSAHAQSSTTPTVPVALAGYQISQWVGPSTAYSHPDSFVADGAHVWVGYQNVTAKDGSDKKTSTVVEYSPNGTAMATFTVPGHNDGLRVDPTTHLVWALSNNDGNPALVTIDPNTGTVTPYTFPPAPHGGGYDDMAFVNGSAFISASNPTLDSSGANPNPAVDKIALAAGQVYLTPVLAGNASALDTTTKQKVTLNEADPDSMRVDPQGDVVLDNQGSSELVFLQNAGTAQQVVTRLPVGTQIDDFVWTTAPTGKLFIVDGPQNTIWQMTGHFDVNTVFVEAPSDSGVGGFVGTLDLTTGLIKPIAIGFGSPTGLEFVSSAGAGIPLAATLVLTSLPCGGAGSRCRRCVETQCDPGL